MYFISISGPFIIACLGVSGCIAVCVCVCVLICYCKKRNNKRKRDQQMHVTPSNQNAVQFEANTNRISMSPNYGYSNAPINSK